MSKRDNSNLSVVSFDVDHFKSINVLVRLYLKQKSRNVITLSLARTTCK
jgi:GGDEF domain-containing protein